MLFENCNAFSVCDAFEGSVSYLLKTSFKSSVKYSVFRLLFIFLQVLLFPVSEEINIGGVVQKDVTQAVLEVVFSQIHVIGQVSEGNLRFNHPELGQMAGSVGVFSSESRSKGVDVTHSTVVVLNCQLTRDGEVSGLSKEVFSVVHLTLMERNSLLDA